MSALEHKGMTISLKAAEDISPDKRYLPVTLDTTADKTFKLASAGDAVIGVIQNETKKGEAGQVMVGGITFYKCTKTVAPGDDIDGWGVALMAGVENDIISVLIGSTGTMTGSRSSGEGSGGGEGSGS